jgi:enoyl-CoA hydratase/carnithine racemase
MAGGTRIGIAADIVIAGESLKLVEAHALARQESAPGLGPLRDDRYIVRLAQTAGRRGAKMFLMSDETLTARQAQNLGLVSAVVPDDQLQSLTDRVTDAIASYPVRNVAYMLNLVDRATGRFP